MYGDVTGVQTCALPICTNEVVAGVAQVATEYGMSTIVLVYLLYLLFAFKYEKLRDAYRIYLLVLLMFGFAGIGGDILKEVFNRFSVGDTFE
jgi:hypothetical protein